jgi:serine/threonine-protein kinase
VHTLSVGPLTAARAVEVLAQVAAATEAVHRGGRAHGGVRLSAVHVTGDGVVELAGPSPDLADGPAAELEYAAPEVFDGESTPAGDVYALGALLHELLTASPPFPVRGLPALMRAHLTQAPPVPSRLRPDVPAALDDVVTGAMAKDPADRPGTVGELVAAARTAVGLPAAAAPARPAPPDADPPAAASPATDATYVPRHGPTDRTYVPPRPPPGPTDRTYVPRTPRS